MEKITMSKNDEIIMKLLHYFVTEHNYNPIVLKGAQNEIWLENLEGEYKIIRLVSNYIHNNEQMEMDIYRTEQIMNKIKKKTMSFNINALSIFVNLGDNVLLEEKINNLSCVNIKELEDLKKYKFVLEQFPNITEKTSFEENGLDLFMKLTSEIGKKNDIEAKKAEDIFTKKTPVITTAIFIINALLFLLLFIKGDSIYSKLGLDIDAIRNGEIYRLLTATFINVNFLQFIFNMYALYVIGPQIENFYGKSKYLIICFVSIIGSSLLTLLFDPMTVISSNIVIYGLIGALLYFGYHYRVYLDTVIKSQIIPIIFLNFVLGYLLIGIAAISQLVGIFIGFLIAKSLGVKYHSNKSDTINGTIMTLILILFLVYMVFM